MTAPPIALPVPRPIGPVRATRHSLTLTVRSLSRLRHSPGQVWDLSLQPIILVTVFVFAFGGAMGGGNRGAYTQYVLPGIMVQSVVFSSLSTGVALHNDITKGIFDRFRSLPIARSAPLIGAILGDLLRYLISLLVVLVYGMVLGFRVHTNPLAVLASIALIMFFALALCWVTAFAGLAAKTPEALQGFGFLVMFPLTFGSNVFVPTSTLPSWMQSWGSLNPVSVLADAVRAMLLTGARARPILVALVWIVAMIGIFAPLAVRAYRRKTWV